MVRRSQAFWYRLQESGSCERWSGNPSRIKCHSCWYSTSSWVILHNVSTWDPEIESSGWSISLVQLVCWIRYRVSWQCIRSYVVAAFKPLSSEIIPLKCWSAVLKPRSWWLVLVHSLMGFLVSKKDRMVVTVRCSFAVWNTWLWVSDHWKLFLVLRRGWSRVNRVKLCLWMQITGSQVCRWTADQCG